MLTASVLVPFVLAQAVKPADLYFAYPARADRYLPLAVLQERSVQKELGLAPDQVKKVDGVQAELTKRLAKVGFLPIGQIPKYQADTGRWADKAIGGVLTDKQLPRYREVVWQMMEFTGGPIGMMTNPVFAKAIGVTADQQKKVAKIEADYQAAWEKLVKMNPFAGGNAALPGEEKLRKETDEKALALLTSEQKKKWNEQLGEPFQGDIAPLTPGLPPFKAPEKK
jgi:hypothetical protein